MLEELHVLKKFHTVRLNKWKTNTENLQTAVLQERKCIFEWGCNLIRIAGFYSTHGSQPSGFLDKYLIEGSNYHCTRTLWHEIVWVIVLLRNFQKGEEIQGAELWWKSAMQQASGSEDSRLKARSRWKLRKVAWRIRERGTPKIMEMKERMWERERSNGILERRRAEGWPWDNVGEEVDNKE